MQYIQVRIVQKNGRKVWTELPTTGPGSTIEGYLELNRSKGKGINIVETRLAEDRPGTGLSRARQVIEGSSKPYPAPTTHPDEG